MPYCYDCKKSFRVPEEDHAEEHGCPRCGILEEEEINEDDE